MIMMASRASLLPVYIKSTTAVYYTGIIHLQHAEINDFGVCSGMFVYPYVTLPYTPYHTGHNIMCEI
jgi:hypothetical protein